MIEVRIPKEINKYEAKFIGPFTFRQSAALLIALPTCVILYNLLLPYLMLELVFIICLIPAVFAFLFGWFELYGMKIEAFLGNVFVPAFIAPSKRIYCTENYYSLLAEQLRKEETEGKAVSKRRAVSAATKKYRRSPDAIR